MKKVTYLWADTTPVKGPLKFERICELWKERAITDRSRLFITELTNERTTKCLLIYAEQIKENLESGKEPNLEALQ